jgi:predicted ABC-type ATPase
MSNPVLFIVAGPNGSGKSLFSKELTKTDLEVFDGDKHMAALVKKYPETGSEALWSFICQASKRIIVPVPRPLFVFFSQYDII